MKKYFLLTIIIFLLISFIQVYPENTSYAFTTISDLVFDGMSVEPNNLQEVLNTVKKNKIKNKTIKVPSKLLPDELFIINSRQKDPHNIQLEIDTSSVLVKSDGDIQAPISNQAFLNAVTEAVTLWDNVDIADITFAPLKFASGGADPNDGKNVITFRANPPLEQASAGSSVTTIVNYARTENIVFMNKLIMVKPGTILDVDIIYDPTNNMCLALHTTGGDFKIGGNESTPIVEGGVDPNASTETLESCKVIFVGDLTEIAVESIAHVLGLTSSAIVSAATTNTSRLKERYALTSDDKIGLANIYPNKANLKNTGIISGKVVLNKKPVSGAHVVLENTTTGEPVTSTITNIKGRFLIKAIPSGSYTVYAEPIDGPVRKNSLAFNFFGFTPNLNFVTGIFPTPITISPNKITNIKLEVKELSASAFNINAQTSVFNEKAVNDAGGASLLPIRIMPGQTLTNVLFWGDNINSRFGTLSVSGPGITVSNVQSRSVPISPSVECKKCEDTLDTMCKRDPRCPPTQELKAEPDQIPGLTADITCASDVTPGPRNIIFTGDQIDSTHPSFGLRDQITGGLFITE